MVLITLLISSKKTRATAAIVIASAFAKCGGAASGAEIGRKDFLCRAQRQRLRSGGAIRKGKR